MKNIDTIIFDMDGTIADLYNYPNWLSYFQNEKRIFHKIAPMIPTREFNKIIETLKKAYDVRIITWLPMNATAEYKNLCRKDKKIWIKEHTPAIDKVHAVQYGTKKHYIKGLSKNAILFDDNKEVRELWEKSGRVAYSEKDILKILTSLIK